MVEILAAIAQPIADIFGGIVSVVHRLIPDKVNTQIDPYEYSNQVKQNRDFTFLYIVGALLLIWLVVIVIMMRR